MNSIKESIKDYARGSIGGFLFSLPLLYTMEIWWIGFILDPIILFFYIIATFIILLGYNRFAGMHHTSNTREIIFESIEEMGLGLLISFLILYLIGRIDFATMSDLEISGKVIMESMLVAIGISVGKAQLEENDNDSKAEKDSDNKGVMAVLAFCGSILIAGNIAPTEEISLIAYSINATGQIAILITAVIIGFLILYYSDFRGTAKASEKGLYEISYDVIVSYVIAALASVLMLWFFGKLVQVPFDVALSRVIVLSLPAMLGASAGSLLLK